MKKDNLTWWEYEDLGDVVFNMFSTLHRLDLYAWDDDPPQIYDYIGDLGYKFILPG